MKNILDVMTHSFDACELFYLNEKGNKIEARDGEICSAEFKEEEGHALRAIRGYPFGCIDGNSRMYYK